MPPPLNGDMAAPGGNNSSDFVRKLYKMLEDPVYDEIVRWGNDGDSFVVLENEKFTKTILPKHFKHSNFASFVRQLNKYDFHKVRHTEDNGAAQYGQGVWEFKHPEFKANMKDNLDNIRRKAPAPRKQTAVVDDSFPNNQQVSLMNESLSAALQQVAGLQDHYYQVVATNKLLVEEVLSLQKTAKAQNQVHHELLNFLDNLDERRRNSKHANQSNPGQGFHSGGLGMLPDSGDEPAPELRRARETLLSVASAVDSPNFGKELERLSLAFQNVSSPPESTTSSTAMFPQQSLGLSMPMSADPFHDVKHLVYPMGQNQGIDPFHADHIHNIPYTQPPMSQAMEATSQITPPPQGAAGQPSIWVKRPYILLVEDDKVCARIGAKFLMQYGCQVDTAGDGMEAVGLVNTDPNRYHLVFMDIIMPNLDGVSAATCIRTENHTGVPIVAMTSNIRQEDIATYFNFGMNDVLAKPFTKEGMIRILKKHLAHMYKNPQEEGLYAEVMPSQQMSTMAFGPGSSGGPMSMAALTANPAVGGPPPQGQAHSVQHAGGPPGHHGIKFDGSAPPMHSPSIKFEGGSGSAGLHSPSTTAGSWNSPGTMSQTSPAVVDASGGQAGYMTAGSGGGPIALTPGGSQRPGGFAAIMAPQVGTPPIPRMPDGQPDDRPEKRQRMYGGAAGFP
ncbi:hypothetical protein RB597_001537 [Gaeumannomyces tritici]